jgi:hypothetical protein
MCVSHFGFYSIKTPMLSPSLAYLFAKYGLPPYLVEFCDLEQKSKDLLWFVTNSKNVLDVEPLCHT